MAQNPGRYELDDGRTFATRHRRPDDIERAAESVRGPFEPAEELVPPTHVLVRTSCGVRRVALPVEAYDDRGDPVDLSLTMPGRRRYVGGELVEVIRLCGGSWG
jgi:hypothetical protein